MTAAKTKPVICPKCKGSGTRTCILGTLTCGQCNGTGKIDPSQDQGFVATVQRQFANPRERKRRSRN